MASLHDASFYCITSEELPSNDRDLYIKVSLSSACLGICGSIGQLFFWHMSGDSSKERRRRSSSSSIALCLAVSNLLSCIGVVARAASIWVTKPPCIERKLGEDVMPNASRSTLIIGTTMEAFTNFMYAASVMWTLAYAVDVYKSLRCCQRPELTPPAVYTYHVLCWGVAACSSAGGTLAIWIHTSFPGKCADRTRLIWRYLFSYIPMLLVLVANPVIYWRSHIIDGRVSRQRGTYTQAEWDKQRMLRIRFLMIVLVYSMCWLPNIADSIAQLVVMERGIHQHTLFPVWMVEAILNPLQGLFNCVLYRPGLMTCLRSCHIRKNRSIQTSVEEDESRVLLGTSGKTSENWHSA